jgi:hypothetical protein
LRHRGIRTLAAGLVFTLALATPAWALDDADISVGRRVGNAGVVVFDVLVLRPLGAIATIGGFVAFLATAPMLAPSQEIPYGWDTFVMGPYEYTVERPLGEV